VRGSRWLASIRFIGSSVHPRGVGCARETAARAVCLALAVTACLAWTITAQAGGYSEEAVKAAFLHRFAAYVQWPEASNASAFVIAVDGSEEVAVQLEQLLPGLTIQNRKAQVRRVQTVADLDGVSILYLAPGRRPQTRPLMQAAAMRPILLVTDTDEGLSDGAIINFVHVERTIRFEVSLTAAERSGLKINSGLLSVAARVEGRPQAGIGCPIAGSGVTRMSCLGLLALHGPARWIALAQSGLL
jgi:hypothetical protein